MSHSHLLSSPLLLLFSFSFPFHSISFRSIFSLASRVESRRVASRRAAGRRLIVSNARNMHSGSHSKVHCTAGSLLCSREAVFAVARAFRIFLARGAAPPVVQLPHRIARHQMAARTRAYSFHTSAGAGSFRACAFHWLAHWSRFLRPFRFLSLAPHSTKYWTCTVWKWIEFGTRVAFLFISYPSYVLMCATSDSWKWKNNAAIICDVGCLIFAPHPFTCE